MGPQGRGRVRAKAAAAAIDRDGGLMVIVYCDGPEEVPGFAINVRRVLCAPWRALIFFNKLSKDYEHLYVINVLSCSSMNFLWWSKYACI